MSGNSLSPLNLGLAGYPLEHSLSPLLHRAALDACGLEGDYHLYPIPPMLEGNFELEALLARVRAGTLHGLNITIPHKQLVLRYLDELTPAARAIGAVNTVFRAEGRLVGENTDAPGFISDLYAHLGVQVGPCTAIVLGAGGSARAIVYSLLKAGWHVRAAARHLEQAKALVDGFRSLPKSPDVPSPPILQTIDFKPDQLKTALSRLPSHESRKLLIVNCTPVGMSPKSDACPWPVDVSFPPGTFVYDLVYNPSNTVLVKLARSQGIPAVSGLGMLVEQAALAFEIWTGRCAPRAAMRTALTDLC